MFATLRIGDHAPVCIESNTKPPGQRSNQQRFACNTCRSKKLKCTGHKEGCDRCRSKDISCTYLPGNTDKKRKPGSSKPSSTRRIESPPGPSSNANSKDNTRSPQTKQRLPSPRNSTMTSGRSNQFIEQPLTTTETLSSLDNPEINLETFVSMTYTDPFDVHRRVLRMSPGPDGPMELTPSVEDVSYSSEIYNWSSQLLPPEKPNTVHLPNFDHRFTSISPPAQGNSQNRTPTIHGVSDTNHSQPSTCSLSPPVDGLTRVGTSLDQFMTPQSPLYRPVPSYDQSLNLHSHNKCHADNVRYALSSGNGAPFQEEPTGGHIGASSSARTHTCKCMQRVLSVHEEVESRKAASLNSADCLLAFQRSVLNECTAILRCELCRNNSAISMLLKTICEKLHRSFQSLFDLCLDMIRSHKRSCPDLHHRKRVSGSQEPDVICQVSFGRYKIESSQEQAAIVIRLVEMQLRELRNLLIQLRDTARHNDWKAHSLRVQQVEHGTRRTLNEILRVTSEAFDKI